MLRGPTITRGYDNDEAATKAAFRDGWFRTGDLGYIDADGYLFIVGRIKDVINRGGQKVSPAEVEEVLLSHPDVCWRPAFPVPHPELGEDVAAAVVLRPKAKTTRDSCGSSPASSWRGYKVPGLIRIVPAIAERRQRQDQARATRRAACDQWPDRERAARPSAAHRAGDRSWPGSGRTCWTAAGRGRSGCVRARRGFADGDADAFAPARTFRGRFLVPGYFRCADRRRACGPHRDAPTPIADDAPGLASVRRRAARRCRSSSSESICCPARSDRATSTTSSKSCSSGALDVAALAASIAAIRERHEALRSVFFEREGEPVQRVLRPPPRLERLELGPCPADKRAASSDARRSELRTSFDIDTSRRCRSLLSFAKSTMRWWSSFIIWSPTDGRSGCSGKNSRRHYTAARKDDCRHCLELPFQYRDFANGSARGCKRRRRRSNSTTGASSSKASTELPLRTDRPRPEAWTGRGARLSEILPDPVGRLRALSRTIASPCS